LNLGLPRSTASTGDDQLLPVKNEIKPMALLSIGGSGGGGERINGDEPSF